MPILIFILLIWPQTVAVQVSPDQPAVIMQTVEAEALYSKLLDGSDPTMFKALTVALGKLPNSIEYFNGLIAEAEWADCRRSHHRAFACVGDEEFGRQGSKP